MGVEIILSASFPRAENVRSVVDALSEVMEGAKPTVYKITVIRTKREEA